MGKLFWESAVIFVFNSLSIQAASESAGRIGEEDALALLTSNLEKIFAIPPSVVEGEYMAYKGGDVMDFTSEVVAAVSKNRAAVDIF